MEKSIIVSMRSQYGNDLVYPECPDARRFAAIANTATLTANTVEAIRQLGYEIKIKTETLPF
jgi:hypothetical protein